MSAGFRGNMCCLYGCFRKYGYPKSSILIGFSLINHPFWGTTIFGNHYKYMFFLFNRRPTWHFDVWIILLKTAAQGNQPTSFCWKQWTCEGESMGQLYICLHDWVFLGGGFNFFCFHPENWGRWTQFDEHMCQLGWNHQLDFIVGKCKSTIHGSFHADANFHNLLTYPNNPDMS